MSLFKIAWRSIQQRALASSLTASAWRSGSRWSSPCWSRKE